MKRPTSELRLSDITTRRHADAPSGSYAELTLGGMTLYAPRMDGLLTAVERVAAAIEISSKSNLLVARNLLQKLAEQNLGEELNERIYGAVLGKTLRLARVLAIPCLTINARVMRMYIHPSNLAIYQSKLKSLRASLDNGTAVSTDAAQLTCFPERGWSTKFIAKQLLSRLAYTGEAVFVDQDLFASTRLCIEDAPRNRRK
jgi:hypothetical protein